MSTLSNDIPASPKSVAAPRLPGWLSALLPAVALAVLIAIFAFANPLALFTGNLPPIEDLTVQRIVVTDTGFEVSVFNGSPAPVTIAQVEVDDAFWTFTVGPSAEVPRLGEAVVRLDYPWVEGEPHVIRLVTSTGATFDGVVGVATETPRPGLQQFLAYGLLGVYVGIIPVALGLMWFPAMKRLGRRGLNAILALTLGLLVFLLIDTVLEALEAAGDLPGAFQGVPLVFFAALLSWLLILAVSSRHSGAKGEADPARRRQGIATIIALGIGLHNLGEGLAIGAAFALGEAALGSFLVIGFTLHNVTEGVGIAAPVTRDQPKLSTFVWLALLAGAPAIVGAWIGGFAFSPLLAALFLGIGAGAIWQVLVEVFGLIKRDSDRESESVFSWLNLLGFVAGIAVMYFTALLVK